MKMHIAFVLPDLKGGGAQKMVINLANWFVQQGHQIDLILFGSKGIYLDLVNPAIKIHDFQKNRSFQTITKLSKYIRNESPDLIFSAMYHVNVVTILSRFVSRKKGIKLVISERNNISRNLGELSGVIHIFWRFLISCCYPLSDRIVCISDGVGKDLKKFLMWPKKCTIETIYNPVITDEFEKNIKSEIVDIFPDGSATKLITSGRLVPQKDYPTLLQSFALYLKIEPHAHLVILGDGYLENDLKTMAKDLKIEKNINFVGFVNNPLPYLKQADIFIITSAWEGFCNVIVEALYCGLNVVATDCISGPAEILKSGEYGILPEVGDTASIAKAISECTKNPKFSEVQHARALDFHVDKIGLIFKSRFEALIES